jgi:hypothetical protein
VGITNRRLLKLDREAQTVCFDYKDYADGAWHKTMQLGLAEFIRRLYLHVLPERFTKIRHYGFLKRFFQRSATEGFCLPWAWDGRSLSLMPMVTDIGLQIEPAWWQQAPQILLGVLNQGPQRPGWKRSPTTHFS